MLKNAKAELRSKNLPTCFTPRGARGGTVAVNVNIPEAAAVKQVMLRHGYEVMRHFQGIDTDYQICFKPARA